VNYREISFLGLGDLYLAPAGGGPARPVGSASQIQLGITEDEKDQQNYGRAGGLLNSVSRITAVTLALTLQSLSPPNLALALRADRSDIEAGTVTGEAHTAYTGALIRIANIDPSDVVVTDASDGTTTYTEGADYKVTSAGVIPLAGGAIDTAIQALSEPSDGLPVTIDYSYGARSVVEALTHSGTEYVLYFDGLNEADSGKSAVGDLWRVKFGAAKQLDLVGDDYAGLELAGKLLADNSKGAGESAFFRWNYAA
jgi:hypothetical protein